MARIVIVNYGHGIAVISDTNDIEVVYAEDVNDPNPMDISDNVSVDYEDVSAYFERAGVE